MRSYIHNVIQAADLSLMTFICRLMIKYYFWYYKITTWKFKLFKAKTTAGLTDFNTNTLYVSSFFLRYSATISMDYDFTFFIGVWKLRNLILHEIAHIKVGCEENHNKVWKNYFLKMGGDGNTCVDPFIEECDYPWILSCSSNKCQQKDLICLRRTRIHCPSCGSYMPARPN
jgi:hypothetical protein